MSSYMYMTDVIFFVRMKSFILDRSCGIILAEEIYERIIRAIDTIDFYYCFCNMDDGPSFNFGGFDWNHIYFNCISLSEFEGVNYNTFFFVGSNCYVCIFYNAFTPSFIWSEFVFYEKRQGIFTILKFSNSSYILLFR